MTSKNIIQIFVNQYSLMYQKDFILRMIEQIATLISGILGLIKKGEYRKASEELGEIYFDMLREDAAFFRAMPGDELTHRLLVEHNYTNGHIEILAELFNAEAELEMAQGKINSCLEYSQKSLILFEFLDNEYKTYSSERLNKMEAIRNRIAELQKNILNLQV
jgi:hypothetical protein